MRACALRSPTAVRSRLFEMDDDRWQRIASWASGGAGIAYAGWCFTAKLVRMVRRGSEMTTLNIVGSEPNTFDARLTHLETNFTGLETRQNEMHRENIDRNDALMGEMRSHRVILDKILSKMAGI
jgi:hypothetical protein